MTSIRPYIRITAVAGLLVTLVSGQPYAQSPYNLDWKRELSISATGMSSLVLGTYLKSRTTLYTSDQLEDLDARDIVGFDRVATHFDSENARSLSDVFLNGSHVLPFALLIPKATRHDAGKIGILWAEVVLVNTGLTNLSKYAFKRPRPFVYNPETRASEIQTIHAQTAFISGHTSATAANCFFAATVFDDYYPDSEWSPVVWSAAAIIPAVTGYLRVKGGKHYPSDVIAGYALGACVGYLVPQLHKTKYTVKGLSGSVRMDAGPDSVRLRWVF